MTPWSTRLCAWSCAAALSTAACGDDLPSIPPDATPAPDATAEGCVAWSGVRLHGGALSDEHADVIVTEEGGLLVAGYADGRHDLVNAVPGGEARGVLHSIDPDGAVETAIVLDGAGPDALDLIVAGGAGAVAAAGRTHAALGGEPVGGARFDVVGGQLDGDTLAAPFRTGVRADDRPVRLVVDGAGALVLAGYAEPQIEGGAVERWEDGFVARVVDGVVARVDADTDAPDVVLALDARDDVIVVGGAVLSGTERGPFVRRLDASLQPVWSTRLSPIPLDAVAWVGLEPDGDVIAVAARTGAAETGQDVAVYRLDGATGDLALLATHGGAGADWPIDAAWTPAGELVVVGETDVGIERPGAGSHDVFAIWFGLDGTVRRVEELGSAGDDHPAAVAVDRCGAAIVVGYASGPIGDVPAHGMRDGLVAAFPP